jgi:prefoldin subunit 5
MCANVYEASGRAVKLLRKDLEAIKAKADEINGELKVISQRVIAIKEQLTKIEGQVSSIKSKGS